MNRNLLSALLCLFATLLLACGDDGAYSLAPFPAPDAGDTGDAGRSGTVTVLYPLAEAERYRDVSQRFAESGLLDPFADWLEDAFLLPEDLTVSIEECGVANAFYSPSERKIYLCYELLGAMIDTFIDAGGLEAEAAVDAAVQAWIWVLYHELGHALVDILDLAVVGGEESAVDNFSTLLFIDGGEAEVAEAAAAFWFLTSEPGATPTELAGVHGLSEQRFYTVLCLLYGADPVRWASLPTRFPEMQARLPRCQDEYDSQVRAWDALLAPHRR
jgi:hypothetical protein